MLLASPRLVVTIVTWRAITAPIVDSRPPVVERRGPHYGAARRLLKDRHRAAAGASKKRSTRLRFASFKPPPERRFKQTLCWYSRRPLCYLGRLRGEKSFISSCLLKDLIHARRDQTRGQNRERTPPDAFLPYREGPTRRAAREFMHSMHSCAQMVEQTLVDYTFHRAH